MDATRKRATLAALAGTAVLVLLSQPVAAQYDSSTESLIRGLNGQLMFVAVPITLLVEGILIYTVLKFRTTDEAKPTRENRRLEITWTVATAVILLFVGVAAYGVMGQPDVTYQQGVDDAPDDSAVEVDVVAQKYFWIFEYENGVETRNTLVLPANEPVYLHITSVDWLHAFHVPDLALKQDAIPAQNNTLRTNVTSTGTYQGYCAEYCGAGHSGMLFTVEVLPEDEYEQWLSQKQAEMNGSSNSSAAVAAP